MSLLGTLLRVCSFLKSKPVWPCFKIQKITYLFKMFLHYGINGLATFLVREEN